jgi:hypothetical protein
VLIYVNGDSHSAGAEAVNPHAFAEDDRLYYGLGRQPHPDNLRASYGCELANLMGAILECDAESASSNDRILRTTYNYLELGNRPDLLVIGWSTWEREEWWDPDTNRWWQVNAGGVGHDWPNTIKSKYKDYIVNIDFKESMRKAQNKIFELHQDLQTLGVNHLFFNSFEQLSNVGKCDWLNCYLEPYDQNFTYYNWLIQKGFQTVSPDSYHFGADAHRAWAEFLYQILVMRKLTQ